MSVADGTPWSASRRYASARSEHAVGDRVRLTFRRGPGPDGVRIFFLDPPSATPCDTPPGPATPAASPTSYGRPHANATPTPGLGPDSHGTRTPSVADLLLSLVRDQERLRPGLGLELGRADFPFQGV